MVEKIKKQRFIWVDYLKATLIFLMVLGHSSQQGIVGEVLSSFHMPAFFMISGFLYHYREPRKLLRSFIIPFAVFYLLWMIKIQTLNYLMVGCIDHDYVLNTIMGLLSSDMSLLGESSFPGYWFLIVLILIRIYAGDLSFFRKLKPFQMQISISIVILFSFFFFLFPRQTQFVSNIYVVKALLCFPFFYFGIYIREINSKKIFNLNFLLLLLLLQFSVSLSEINGPTNLMLSDFKMGYVPFIINTFPMTLFLMNLFSKIPPPGRPRLVNRGLLIS